LFVVFILYINKDNPSTSTNSNPKATIFKIYFRELDEILRNIKLMLMDVDKSLDEGRPIYSYGREVNTFPDNLEFWQHDDVYYSETMRYDKKMKRKTNSL
jgi:hypothetical protein